MATSKAELFNTEPAVPLQDDSELKPNRNVQAEQVVLKSSRINAHDDSGSDPYNSTGQYVILEANQAARTNEKK